MTCRERERGGGGVKFCVQVKLDLIFFFCFELFYLKKLKNCEEKVKKR